MQQPAKLVDLDEFLLDVGDGWSRTPEVELRGWTDDDGTHADRVADPSRTGPGAFVWGPAVVVLEVAPDHGRRLIVRDPS